MSNDLARIGMVTFIRLLDDQVEIGDNGLFRVDKNGIESTAPTEDEMNTLGLSKKEKLVLATHTEYCELKFPCTIEQVRRWLERNSEFKSQRAMRKLNFLLRCEKRQRETNNSETVPAKASGLWFWMHKTIVDLYEAHKATRSADDAQMPTQEDGTSETTAASAVEIPSVEPGKPGRRVTNAEAAAFAIQIHQSQPKENKNMAEACRQAVKEHFPGHHDPEGKAKCIAGTIRNQRNKAKP